MVRVAVDLPFVPTTCTEGNARSGLPSSSSSARMFSSPNSSGHGLRLATQAVFASPAEGIELAPVALELLSLGGHDLGRRIRDKLLVREHLLAATDLLEQPRALGIGVAGRLVTFRFDDGVEDPLLVRLQLCRQHAAATEHRCGVTHSLERGARAGI